MPSLHPAVLVRGTIYTGPTHLDALMKVPQQWRASAELDGDNRGYVTDTGRFLDRDQATDYAVEHDLVVERYRPYVTRGSGALISEFLRNDTMTDRMDAALAKIDGIARSDAQFMRLETGTSNRGYTNVYQNPTRGTVKAIIRQAQEHQKEEEGESADGAVPIRGWHDNSGTLHMWDAYDATHQDVIQQLGENYYDNPSRASIAWIHPNFRVDVQGSQDFADRIAKATPDLPHHYIPFNPDDASHSGMIGSHDFISSLKTSKPPTASQYPPNTHAANKAAGQKSLGLESILKAGQGTQRSGLTPVNTPWTPSMKARVTSTHITASGKIAHDAEPDTLTSKKAPPEGWGKQTPNPNPLTSKTAPPEWWDKTPAINAVKARVDAILRRSDFGGAFENVQIGETGNARVYHDPTKTAIKALVRNAKPDPYGADEGADKLYIRGITSPTTGRLTMWDATDATHWQMMTALGESGANQHVLTVVPSKKTGDIYSSSNDNKFFETVEKALPEYGLRRHPY